METDFRALLAGAVPIINQVEVRIYPTVYPQNATDPAVRYQKITGSIGLHMQGSDGLSGDLMQVDVRCDAQDQAGAVAKVQAIRTAIVDQLHGFEGIQGSTDFRVIALRDDRGVRFEKTDAKAYYTTSLDFDVWSRRAA